MKSKVKLALASASALAALPVFAAAQTDPQAAVPTITVTAARLNEARIGIQTKIGASTYTITSKAINAQPGGDNNLLSQVIIQAPGVAQDSFGQLHVRGEHNGLQYRLNGIIIPEGISVFGQTLDPRLANSVDLITGALPAEYGLRTAGVIDVQTKAGTFTPGGHVGVYGGSHSDLQPSFDYGGSAGSFNYFVSGDYLTNTLGIESPDGRSSPDHDRTRQYHGFVYLQDIIDGDSSVTGIFGTSRAQFQIPNQIGLQPSGLDGIAGLGPGGILSVNGQSAFPSENLNENQREITHYGIVSYLHSAGALDLQISGFGRYSSLFFVPDAVGDLLYNGIAQTAFKRDEAYGIQAEAAWHLGSSHTIRGGAFFQGDDLISNTSSEVLSVDALGNQTAPDAPVGIIDNAAKHAWSYSAYIQDEWKLLESLTLNYGVRYDVFSAFVSESQVSPRLNVVWKPLEGMTVHAGYSRYFSPPPIELISNTSIALFANTTAAPTSLVDDTPRAERANYYDIGVEQSLDSGITLGLDTYYKTSKYLLDEGQFGAPIILTPFNYRDGRQYGAEFTANYLSGPFSAYANLSYERAMGRGIVSSQFNFDPADLAFIATHYIPLDHQQILSLSAGTSYHWRGTGFSADLIYGSGLRKDGATPNGSHVSGYTQVNLGVSHEFDLGTLKSLTVRADVINLFDEKYEIRDGSGIGVGAPQFGPRRGFFVGISKAL